MGRVQFVEIDESAWKPLPENQRLDAYYMHCELSGATRLLKLAEEHKEFKDDPTVIKAESLGVLKLEPSAEAGGALDRLRRKIEGDDEEEDDEEEPGTTTEWEGDDGGGDASKQQHQKKKSKPKPAVGKDKISRVELKPLDTGDSALDDAGNKGKKKKRPKTAGGRTKVVQGSVVPKDDVSTAASANLSRPQSAPARIMRPPVTTYGSLYTKEVRGKPMEPLASVEVKAGSKTGYHNTILSDEPAPERPKPLEPVVKSQPMGRRTGKDVKPLVAVVTPRGDSLTPRGDVILYERVVTFTGVVSVSFEAPTMWSTLRYTLDGSTPTRASKIYQGAPLEIRSSVTVRSISVKRSWLSEECTVRFVRRTDLLGVKERIRGVSHTINDNLARRSSATAKIALDALTHHFGEELIGCDQQSPDDANVLRAVKLQDVPKVRALLEAGASPSGGTLIQAARLADVILTQLLLSHGADVHFATADSGATALHVACQHAAPHVANCLIAAGSKVDAGMLDGRRPVHLACAAGARRCVENLLRASAHVDEATGNGEHAIHTLARHLPDTTKQPPSSSSSGITPLNNAPSNVEPRDWTGTIKALVDGGVDLNAKNKDGKRAVNIAARRGATEFVEVLVKAGAHPPNTKEPGTNKSRKSKVHAPPGS